MKPLHYIYIGVAVLLLLMFSASVVAATSHPDGRKEGLADSIMQKVTFFAPHYEKLIDSYKAELYVKGRVNLRKKNILLRFVPSMFRVRKGVREYMMESYSDLNYSSPNIYDQKLKAGVGTASEFWELDGRLPEYFHLNIYAPTLLSDKLLSPLARDASKYYNYRVDSVMGEAHNLHYCIAFEPKYRSYQLVTGYLVVSEDVWSVREMRFSGRSEMLHFDNLVEMGKVGESDEFLPIRYDMQATFRFLGNVVDGSYQAQLRYNAISQRKPDIYRQRLKRRSKYNLTESYTLRCDTNSYRVDTTYFNSLRPNPLSAHERQLYKEYFQRRDTLNEKRLRQNRTYQFWGRLGDVLISRNTVDLSQRGSVRFSPLLNPLLLSYSGTNGFSYRQELRYNHLFPGDRLLHIAPRIGYNFKLKEFYWRLGADFEYWPAKRAALHLEVGNGNRIYSSDVLDDLKAIPDSVFDFSQIHLDYFKDLYLKFRHSWEIVNGLSLDVGFSMHRRTEVERSRLVVKEPAEETLSTDGVNSEFLQKIRHTYKSFAPRVRLTWTPGQYYYMNGKRKVNLYSKYPQISIDWERGISGVLGSTGKYERWEMDFQHRVPLGVMCNFYYRLGWGAFTNQKEVYFVDFSNFTRSNLPVGWNDEIGGVFQLLEGQWYNSSRKYLRAHATYEAPFLLMPHLKKYAQHVLNERLYLNLLSVPHLKPYVELGYGIGTHIFDFGLFVGFANWKYEQIGCKFTFELFNR